MSTGSIRAEVLEVLKAGILFVLTDTDSVTWGITADAIVAEPNAAPAPVEDWLSMRIMALNQKLTATADTTISGMTIWSVSSTIRIQCIGARAWGWLDTFLSSLADTPTIDHFADQRCAVIDDGDGVSDIGIQVGPREQLRGVAEVKMTYRSVRDRVIVEAESILGELELDDFDTIEIETSLE